VDIGTLFCDISYKQTIAGIKTFSGTVIVNNSDGWTEDTSMNAVNKNYIKDQGYAPINSPVFTGTPKVDISGTNYPILTTNDLSGLNDVTFTGSLPYYDSGPSGTTSGSMATQPWVNSVISNSKITTVYKNSNSYSFTITNAGFYFYVGVSNLFGNPPDYDYGVLSFVKGDNSYRTDHYSLYKLFYPDSGDNPGENIRLSPVNDLTNGTCTYTIYYEPGSNFTLTITFLGGIST
jgi:hypothetical protein